MKTEKNHMHIPMVCVCSQEGQEEADALMLEVINRLSAGSPELMARQIPRDELMTAIVVSLQWDYRAEITGIHNDQWSAVSASSRDGGITAYVECDVVEHGFAAIWKAFADYANHHEGV